MPLPIPKPKETQEEFVGRFMSNEAMKKEYPDNKQRLAVAYSAFKRKEESKDAEGIKDVCVHDRVSIANDKFEITPEGYLKVEVNFTRPGVFIYYRDGKPVRRLRPDEEVFDKESMQTLSLQPITDLHPDKEVTAENIRKHHRGVVSERIKPRNGFVSGYAVIQDKELIEDIMRKHKQGKSSEVSCGYVTNIVPIPGIHPIYGEYDEVQTKIRYNHVAIVEQGRMGPEAKLLLDKKQNKEETSMIKLLLDAIKTAHFNMDSMEVEVPEESKASVTAVVQKLRDAASIISSLEAEVEKGKAQSDQKEEKIKKLEKDVADLSSPTSEKIQALVADSKRMTGLAEFLKVSVTDSDGKAKTREALRNEIIKTACGDGKFDTASRTNDYLEARYEVLCEDFENEKLQRDKEVKDIKDFASDGSDKANKEDTPLETFKKATHDMAALPSEKSE